MKRIGVVTTSRADYGLLRPILRAIAEDASLDLRLYVTGSHTWMRFGHSIDEILADGFAPTGVLELQMDEDFDTPTGLARTMSRVTDGFAQILMRDRPEVLVVIGDRYEMFAACSAAVPCRIPIAHVHGGEITRGAIDECFRHAMTKLAHLHFVAAEPFAQRLRQMGEESWRVHVSGAPSLDNLRDLVPLDRQALERELEMTLPKQFLLATCHPETLSPEETAHHARLFCDALRQAMREHTLGLVVTYPNADTGSGHIAKAIEALARGNVQVRLFRSLGGRAYFSMMHHARAMVGNSSSGIIEAASFELPVVDLGDRQAGRLHGSNVLHAPWQADAIAGAIGQAVSDRFRASIRGMDNPYGDGHAAGRIAEALKVTQPSPELLRKRFVDTG